MIPLVGVWVAVLLTGGGYGVDTTQAFRTEAACERFVAQVERKTAAKKNAPHTYGVCVEKS